MVALKFAMEMKLSIAFWHCSFKLSLKHLQLCDEYSNLLFHFAILGTHAHHCDLTRSSNSTKLSAPPLSNGKEVIEKPKTQNDENVVSQKFKLN